MSDTQLPLVTEVTFLAERAKALQEAANAAHQSVSVLSQAIVDIAEVQTESLAAVGMLGLRLVRGDGTREILSMHPQANRPGHAPTGIAGVPTALAEAHPFAFFRSPMQDSDGELRLDFVYYRPDGELARASVPAAITSSVDELIEAVREVIGPLEAYAIR